jgi:putative two-component system response regulator
MTTKSRILIVDDTLENIKLAIAMLKEGGYELTYAQSGAEALSLILDERKSFDLILLDIIMPGIGGFEVCRKLKANSGTADIPIIFLTALVDVETIAKAFDLGGVDYVTKPFHAKVLMARVKTHLELHHSSDLLRKHNLYLNSKAQLEKQRFNTELEDSQKEMVVILTKLMETNSDETGQHIKRIAEISALIAHYHPGLNDDDVETIYHASPMHDIGKMTVLAEVMQKPGLYSKEEFAIMKTHTSKAYEILSRSDQKIIKAAAIIAHEHHEKWDGSGYPRGLKGHEIHIYGRIVALADVFDSLTHKRAYKSALEINEAAQYIIERRGTQFDPEIVDIFLAHLDDFIGIAISEKSLFNFPGRTGTSGVS